MLIRSRSSHNNFLPQPQTAVVKHRNEVQEKTRQIFSKNSSRLSQRKLSTAIWTTATRTNNFFKPQSQQANYKQRNSLDQLRPDTALRPFTEESGRCHRAQSPLAIIRTRSKILSRQLDQKDTNTIKKKDFLRRGSAIDKSIINNVLKSKFNQNICTPAFSYCDHDQNKELINVIASQIPKGIRDVIGVEQMMRMSHIFTGTQFKNQNLTKKVKLSLSQVKNQFNHGDEDDNLTLKSIKRW